MRLAPLILALFVSSGCTAVRANVYLAQAEAAVDRAQQAGAPELAEYEYAMAVRHLEKSKEEVGYSDYKDAVELAQEAAKWADQAVIVIGAGGLDIDLEGLPEAGDEPEPTPSSTGSGAVAPSPEPEPVVVPAPAPTPAPEPVPVVAPEPAPTPEPAPEPSLLPPPDMPSVVPTTSSPKEEEPDAPSVTPTPSDNPPTEDEP